MGNNFPNPLPEWAESVLEELGWSWLSPVCDWADALYEYDGLALEIHVLPDKLRLFVRKPGYKEDEAFHHYIHAFAWDADGLRKKLTHLVSTLA